MDRKDDRKSSDSPDQATPDDAEAIERAKTAARHAKEGRPLHDKQGAGGKDPVDEASKESFPASDPPSWTPNTSAGDKGKD